MISRAPIFGEIPSNLTRRYDSTSNDGDGNPPPTGSFSYVGYAKRGTPTTDTIWFIERYTYSTTSPFPIVRIETASRVAWDSRTTASYA